MKPSTNVLLLLIIFSLLGCQRIAPANISNATPTPTIGINESLETASTPNSNNIILDTKTSDFNGDGKVETAQLIYNADLMLQVGSKSIKIMGELTGVNDADSKMYIEKPSLSILQSSNHEKAILVSIVWSTNKIGSSAALWVFKYKNQQLSMIWDGTDSNPVGEILYHPKTNPVLIQFPYYGINKEISLDENQKQWIARLTENDDSSSKHVAISPDLTEYKVNINPNGQSELMTRRLLCFDSALFYLTPIDTFYHLQGGKIVLIGTKVVNSDTSP